MYLKTLISNLDILFLCEHWLVDKDKKDIEEISSTHNLYFLPALAYDSNRGRPFGGLLWLVKKNISVSNVQFFNQHISILKITLFDREIHLYGLYTFYNRNSFENTQNQINLLNICEEAIKTSRELNHPVIILGDFNSDPYRNNHFDKVFNNFVIMNNLSNIKY